MVKEGEIWEDVSDSGSPVWEEKPSSTVFPKSQHQPKFLCFVASLTSPAVMASSVNASVQDQCVVLWGWNKSLDPPVPFI